jgi:hypothetical protein
MLESKIAESLHLLPTGNFEVSALREVLEGNFVVLPSVRKYCVCRYRFFKELVVLQGLSVQEPHFERVK